MKNTLFNKLTVLVLLVFGTLGLSAQVYNGTTGPVPATGTSGPASFTVNVSLGADVIGTDTYLDALSMNIDSSCAFIESTELSRIRDKIIFFIFMSVKRFLDIILLITLYVLLIDLVQFHQIQST